jgi:hypothetical protein
MERVGKKKKSILCFVKTPASTFASHMLHWTLESLYFMKTKMPFSESLSSSMNPYSSSVYVCLKELIFITK